MPGKTNVGGTLYDISASKVIHEGTSYDITAGKTRINDALYNIEFSEPTLKDLFMRANVLAKSGKDSATTGTVGVSKNNAPASGTAYWFSAVGDKLVVYKIVDRVVQTSGPVFAVGSTILGTISGIHESSAGVLSYYSSSGYRTTGSASSVYGGSVFLISFPYPDSVVDSIFESAGKIINDGHPNANATMSSKSTVYTSRKTYDLFFVAHGSNYDVWESDGNNWTFICGTDGTQNASCIYNSSLYANASHSQVYSGTIVGFKYAIPDPKDVKILNGTGGSNNSRGYVEINGVQYYTSQSTTFHVATGDLIRFAVYQRYSTDEGGVHLDIDYDRRYVSSAGIYPIDWRVPSGPGEINITFSSSSSLTNIGVETH